MSLSTRLKTAIAYAFGIEGTTLATELATAVDANTTRAALSGDVSNDANGVTTIGAGKVTTAMIAPNAVDGTVAANVADANVIGGIPLLFRFDIAAGALADKDIVMTHKVRVINAWLVLRGAGVASTTLTVKNGATAITDAMAASGSAKAVVRCATIDPAQWEVAAAGTLRVTAASGASQPDATVFVEAIRVA